VHRFFRREGELLVPFAEGDEIVRSSTVTGFWLRRTWLNPRQLPVVATCLAEIGG
jgi:hypothetical protein